jgi:hypothetical protein
MTLLELSVALVVGGAALAAGGAAFTTLADRRAALLASVEADTRALAARRALEGWLQEARAGSATDDGLIGMDGTRRTPSGNEADDELTWFTTADAEPRRVRLFVDRAADGSSLVAELARPGAPVTRLVLARDVVGLDARYLTTAFGRREWRNAWAGGALLPGAIELRLQPRAGASLAAALQLPLTVPLPNGR